MLSEASMKLYLYSYINGVKSSNVSIILYIQWFALVDYIAWTKLSVNFSYIIYYSSKRPADY